MLPLRCPLGRQGPIGLTDSGDLPAWYIVHAWFGAGNVVGGCVRLVWLPLADQIDRPRASSTMGRWRRSRAQERADGELHREAQLSLQAG